MHRLGKALPMILFECLDQLHQRPSLLSLRQEFVDYLHIRRSFRAELGAQSAHSYAVSKRGLEAS